MYITLYENTAEFQSMGPCRMGNPLLLCQSDINSSASTITVDSLSDGPTYSKNLTLELFSEHPLGGFSSSLYKDYDNISF